MVVFILCPECSEDLSVVYPFWNIVKNCHIEQILKDSKTHIDINKLDFKPEILSNFGFILDGLRIKNMCCRTHMLGNTDFDSLI